MNDIKRFCEACRKEKSYTAFSPGEKFCNECLENYDFAVKAPCMGLVMIPRKRGEI